MRTIVRVSPQGHLTAHQAGTKPYPDYKEKWLVLIKWNDRKNRPITDLLPYAYKVLIHLHQL